MMTRGEPRLVPNHESDRDILERLVKLDEAEHSGQRASLQWTPARLALLVIVLFALSSLITYFLLTPREIGTVVEDVTAGDEVAETVHAGSVATPIAKGSTVILEAPGYAVARNKASVSSDITGRIQAIEVVIGQWVSEGDIIAVLDDREARLRLTSAEFKIEQSKLEADRAKVALQLERQKFERTLDLSKQKVISDAAFDQAKAALEIAVIEAEQARVASLNAVNEHDAAQIFVERHVIRAPFDGIIVEVTAQEGETVSPTSGGGSFIRTGIVHLVDPHNLYIVAEVPERQFGTINVGQPVEVAGKGTDGAVHLSQVEWIAPVSSRQRGVVEVGISLPKLFDKFIDGMEIDVRFLKNSVNPDMTNQRQN